MHLSLDAPDISRVFQKVSEKNQGKIGFIPLTIGKGLDINLTADVAATAEAMLGAEQNLRGKAYAAILIFMLEAFIAIGLYALLREDGSVLSLWSLVTAIAAGLLVLLGGVSAMNAAEFAGNAAYQDLATAGGQDLLTRAQATSDYTSFHMSLVLSSLSKAGFFYLFLRSGLIPKILAGWGVFASLFVAFTARDFVSALANDSITMAFMLCSLIAIVGLTLYLLIKGVRSDAETF